MGFSNIAAQIIMFSVLIYAAAVLIISIKDYSVATTASLKDTQELSLKELKTDIAIQTVAYDPSPNLTIAVRNTGKTLLNLDYVDVYVNGTRIPRNESNRTIEMNSSTDLFNPDLWDPEEDILINVSMELAAGTYRIDVHTQYSGIDSMNLVVT